jgi:hypothetical protein
MGTKLEIQNPTTTTINFSKLRVEISETNQTTAKSKRLK